MTQYNTREQLTVTSSNPIDFTWGVNMPDIMEQADICGDCFELYEYEDYIGVAHQLMAEEMGYATL